MVFLKHFRPCPGSAEASVFLFFHGCSVKNGSTKITRLHRKTTPLSPVVHPLSPFKVSSVGDLKEVFLSEYTLRLIV
jgi:hypothetical protein